MERLAALVPRPSLRLTRYHGVLGPHYKYRKEIVPEKKPELTLAAAEPVTGADTEAGQEPLPPKNRISWARLLKRVFNIDISICSRCA